MTVHLMPADLAAAWDRTNIASQDMKSRNHYKKIPNHFQIYIISLIALKFHNSLDLDQYELRLTYIARELRLSCFVDFHKYVSDICSSLRNLSFVFEKESLGS